MLYRSLARHGQRNMQLLSGLEYLQSSSARDLIMKDFEYSRGAVTRGSHIQVDRQCCNNCALIIVRIDEGRHDSCRGCKPGNSSRGTPGGEYPCLETRGSVGSLLLSFEECETQFMTWALVSTGTKRRNDVGIGVLRQGDIVDSIH